MARSVFSAAGSGQLLEQEGVQKITHVLRDYSAPGALDSVYRDVAHFLHSERVARTMGDYVARSYLLQRKTEARMQMGGPFPGTFVSISCMQDAPLSEGREVAGIGQ